MMKAQVIEQVGPANVFTLKEIEKPAAKAGEVVIAVKATSVNPIDTKVRSGAVAAAPALPAILHGDVAGIVVEVGEGVTAFQVGDEVYGCAGGFKSFTGGALAEFLAADARLLAKKPHNLTMEQAAALPLVTITAWEALFERGNLQQGESILIHGATGGVGHIAIQLAKWAGATVYTTVSSDEKAALAKQLGADHVIYYKEEAVADYVARYTDGEGFDIIFDTVGGANLDRSFEAAALGGRIVAIAARSTHDLSPLHSKGLTLHVVFMMLKLLKDELHANCGHILTEVTAIAEGGQLVPHIDARHFTFDEITQAHELMESGQAVGKIVVKNEWA